MLSSSRFARACTPRKCSQRSVAARAAFSSDEFSIPDVERVAGQVTSAAESVIDNVGLVKEDLSANAASQMFAAFDKAKALSADVYSGAVSAGSGAELAGRDMSNQLSGYVEQASQVSAEMMSHSSVVAKKVSAAMSEKLETLPEVQVQLAGQVDSLLSEAETALAGVAGASEGISRQFTNEILPRVSSEIESFTQLAGEGQYADAATSPAGIAAAGLSVLLLGRIAASSGSSASSSTAPAASSADPSPAENRASAEAWIARWRTGNAEEQLTPAAYTSSSRESSDSSSDDTLDPTESGASSNGAYASNGAAPEAGNKGMEMTFAEYITGDASDDTTASGWYVASDSEAEDFPYSDVYAPGGNGSSSAATTESASEVVAETAAPATASATEAEDTVDIAADAETAAAGTATLEGAAVSHASARRPPLRDPPSPVSLRLHHPCQPTSRPQANPPLL